MKFTMTDSKQLMNQTQTSQYVKTSPKVQGRERYTKPSN